MTRDELRAAFKQLEREAFRLEVQQSYGGVADPGWDAWQAGRPLPERTVDNDWWLAEVASHVAAGRRRYRVLVVDRPPTDYVRYELAAFAFNIAAGEEIFVVLREADPELFTLTEDFWMLDERFVAIMRYDENNRPLGPAKPTESVETYVAHRKLALKHAVRLREWVADHKELLTA